VEQKHIHDRRNNVKVSPLQLEAPVVNRTDTGSLSATYSIKADNGFMDGEEKKIPVYFVGTTESKGSFSVLARDTVIHTKPDSDKHFTGKSWIMIDGSLLDVMLREIENLKVYPYGCTEQLTTKLLAISYEEKVKKIMGVDIVNNEAARDSIVKALIKLQNDNGSFGWWNEKQPDYRITNYVLSTMQKIDPAYRSALIVQRGLLFLENNLPLMPVNERIISLRTLSEYGYNMKYADHLANINDTFQNIHDQFTIVTIKKQQGLPYRYLLDTLMKQGKWEHGLHWNQFSYDWYRNDIPTTLMGYKLIEKDSVYGHLADNIMQYLLYSRRGGYYRNTAESGQVLTTLLPGLMANTNTTISNRYTEVIVSGSISDTLRSFPKTYERRDKNIDVTINKKGLGPAYVSVVYDYLTAEPEAKKDVLKINTYFIKGRDTLTELVAGTEVNLKVVVNVDTTMEYVMIEVPIPAGCSQVAGKTRGYRESNRENYKDRTMIYCGNLAEGPYEFDIPLEVRYKGSYHMNPARAAMMYYPDKYGNNEVKLVKIK
jgi:alpha-2-macroglobulin